MAPDGLLQDAAVLAIETGNAAAASAMKRTLVRRLVSARRLSGRGRTTQRLRARLWRIGHRVRLSSGRPSAASACARRELTVWRQLSLPVERAAALNNLGVALLAAGRVDESKRAFEECARVRERLDDERGLVVVLNNLALAHARSGDAGSSAGVLNRARVIAARNGLTRHAMLSSLHLGLALVQSGELRDARHLFRKLMTTSRKAGDRQAYGHALLNYASLAVDSWHIGAAERLIARARSESEQVASLKDAVVSVETELALRTQDWERIERIAGAEGSGLASALLATNRGLRPDEHSARPVRFRALVQRCVGRAISPNSLERLLRLAKNEVASRCSFELVTAHLARAPETTVGVVERAWEFLAAPENRVGNDDLQVAIRAHMSHLLRSAGRTREASAVAREALGWFRRLERKLRGSGGVSVLDGLFELLSSNTGTRHRCRDRSSRSVALESDAYRALADLGPASEQRTNVMAEIASAIAMSNHVAATERLLDVAVEATGARRAVLVAAGSERRVLAARSAGGTNSRDSERISWAIVSKVLETGTSELYSDALAASQLASHRSIAVLNLRSLACVPVRDADGVRGALYLDHHGMAGLFRTADVGLLSLVANAICATREAGRVRESVQATESRLALAHRHVVRSEKNRIAGEVASGLAHDIKNMLTTIVARSQLMVTQELGDRHALSSIEAAASSAAEMITRLQEASKEHESQRDQMVDVGRVARETLELLAPRFEKQSITTQVEGSSSARVLAVLGEFRELFLNLFVNAADAMPNGGCLDVRISDEADEVVVDVSDTGGGMAPHVARRVFEPFFTTKDSNGTGLGLAQVKSVIIRHGGTISVDSEEGVGTRFTIVLPAVAAKNEAGRREGAPIESDSTN